MEEDKLPREIPSLSAGTCAYDGEAEFAPKAKHVVCYGWTDEQGRLEKSPFDEAVCSACCSGG